MLKFNLVLGFAAVALVAQTVRSASAAQTVRPPSAAPIPRSALVPASSDGLRILDLEGRFVDPFQTPSAVRAIVFVFASTDCPLTNRYAPDIRRLHDQFAPQGVLFRLVYPNPADSASAIRDHRRAFGYPMEALRDPRHDLVRLVKATVTPEAAVFDLSQRLLYRGRIDDRYVELGIDRQTATRRDLEAALAATLAGKPVAEVITRAVGCLIADMQP